MSSGTGVWANAWTREESLRELNNRIHDLPGLSEDQLRTRATWLVETALRAFPEACEQPPTTILDLGAGVGWPAEVLLRRYPSTRLIDLDVSENMQRQLASRFRALSDGLDLLSRVQFTLYDGDRSALDADVVDAGFSFAAMWHVPTPNLALTLSEAVRLLRPGKWFVAQFLRTYDTPRGFWVDHSRDQVRGTVDHLLHYYVPEQLEWMFWQAGLADVRVEAPDEPFIGQGPERPFLWAGGRKPG